MLPPPPPPLKSADPFESFHRIECFMSWRKELLPPSAAEAALEDDRLDEENDEELIDCESAATSTPRNFARFFLWTFWLPLGPKLWLKEGGDRDSPSSMTASSSSSLLSLSFSSLSLRCCCCCCCIACTRLSRATFCASRTSSGLVASVATSYSMRPSSLHRSFLLLGGGGRRSEEEDEASGADLGSFSASSSSSSSCTVPHWPWPLTASICCPPPFPLTISYTATVVVILLAILRLRWPLLPLEEAPFLWLLGALASSSSGTPF